MIIVSVLSLALHPSIPYLFGKNSTLPRHTPLHFSSASATVSLLSHLFSFLFFVRGFQLLGSVYKPPCGPHLVPF